MKYRRTLGSLNLNEILTILSVEDLETLKKFNDIFEINEIYKDLSKDIIDGESERESLYDDQKFFVIKEWMRTTSSEISLENLEILLQKTDHGDFYGKEHHNILSIWLETEKGKNFDLEELTRQPSIPKFCLMMLSQIFMMKIDGFDLSQLDTTLKKLLLDEKSINIAISNFFLIFGRDMEFATLKQSIIDLENKKLGGLFAAGWFRTKEGQKCSRQQLDEFLLILDSIRPDQDDGIAFRSDTIKQKEQAINGWFHTQDGKKLILKL